MMLPSPTWTELLKYIKRGLPLTAAIAERFRLANHLRRRAFRVASAPILQWWRDHYPQATPLTAPDIPQSVARGYAPLGNHRSLMASQPGGVSGNLLSEIQSSQTASSYSSWDSPSGNWIGSHFMNRLVAGWGRSSPVWAILNRHLDINGRLHGLEANWPYSSGTFIWPTDMVSMGSGPAWSAPIYGDQDLDWCGHSPPEAGAERPKVGWRIASRGLMEVWLLLKRLCCILGCPEFYAEERNYVMGRASPPWTDIFPTQNEAENAAEAEVEDQMMRIQTLGGSPPILYTGNYVTIDNPNIFRARVANGSEYDGGCGIYAILMPPLIEMTGLFVRLHCGRQAWRADYASSGSIPPPQECSQHVRCFLSATGPGASTMRSCLSGTTPPGIGGICAYAVKNPEDAGN